MSALALATEPPVLFPARRFLASEISGVPDEAWTGFTLAMKIQAPGAVSASNELGMFGIRLRRLADLGLVKNLRKTRSPTGHMVWLGDWVPPLTQKLFLDTPRYQYKAFAGSMRRYDRALRDGLMAHRPEGLTLSGMLAVLHRCGPSGLESWARRDRRFPATVEVVERANGIF